MLWMDSAWSVWQQNCTLVSDCFVLRKGNGGLTVKFIYCLMVVAFLGISASVARADGVDPIVTTKGCGGTTICDAVILTPGQTTVNVTEQFTCDLTGNCTAEDSVINETGKAIDTFTLVFDTLGGTLSYFCGEGGSFSCTNNGGGAFTFTGSSICSTDANDISIGEGGVVTFIPDGDADDNCNFGVTIGLSATTTEGITNGETVTATFSTPTPEPSSALLLLFGLMAGFVSFKSLRTNQA